MLRILERTGKFESPEDLPEEAVDLPEHRDLARRAAEESMVLISNRQLTEGKYTGRNVLPITPQEVSKLAVIGPNAVLGQLQGGGSSGVMPHYQVMPLDVLPQTYSGAEVAYEVGCYNHKYLPTPETGTLFTDESRSETGMRLQMFAGEGCEGQALVDRRLARGQSMMGAIPLNFLAAGQMERGFSAIMSGVFQPAESGSYTFGLLSSGQTRMFMDDVEIIDNWSQQDPGESFFGAGSAEKRTTVDLDQNSSYQIRLEFQDEPSKMITGLRYGVLPPIADDLLDRAVKIASTADAVILVVGSNSDWDTEGNDRTHLDLPGQQNELVEKVLAVNDRCVVVMNTGGAMHMPWLDDAGAVIQAWLPGQEFGNALSNIISGEVAPSGRMATTFPRRLNDMPAFANYPGEAGHVRYGERVFMGYRWYDTRDVDPEIAFGHGLGYSQFEFSNLNIPEQGNAGEVTKGDLIKGAVEITNTGDRVAQEVVQVYIKDMEASVQRPEQELKVFHKVLLEAGETRRVEIELSARAFSFWDLQTHNWKLEPGDFEIRIGASSRDIRLTSLLHLA